MVRILLAIRRPFNQEKPLVRIKSQDLAEFRVFICLHRIISFQQSSAGIDIPNAIMIGHFLCPLTRIRTGSGDVAEGMIAVSLRIDEALPSPTQRTHLIVATHRKSAYRLSERRKHNPHPKTRPMLPRFDSVRLPEYASVHRAQACQDRGMPSRCISS